MNRQVKQDISRMHLMLQTPYTLFAYWHLASDYVALAQNIVTVKAALCLRLQCEDDTQAYTVSEYPINNLDGSFYLHIPRPNVSYTAELGLSAPDCYFTILRSQEVSPLPGNHHDAKHSSRANWPTLPFAYSPAAEIRERRD